MTVCSFSLLFLLPLALALPLSRTHTPQWYFYYSSNLIGYYIFLWAHTKNAEKQIYTHLYWWKIPRCWIGLQFHVPFTSFVPIWRKQSESVGIIKLVIRCCAWFCCCRCCRCCSLLFSYFYFISPVSCLWWRWNFFSLVFLL